jgi:3-oxoacyl-[acyl-carrier protein] reductase
MARNSQSRCRVVNILSSAIVGAPPIEMGAYVTAKSALAGMSKSLAVELAADGITVNSVSPSTVLTDQWEHLQENRRRALTMRNPMRQLVTAEDVAQAVLYLVSDAARTITGQNITLTGGEVM